VQVGPNSYCTTTGGIIYMRRGVLRSVLRVMGEHKLQEGRSIKDWVKTSQGVFNNKYGISDIYFRRMHDFQN